MPGILAIIPARGGSKGLPRKNLRLFCGVPLVSVTVWQAAQSVSISRIVVSTDDEEIAAAAERFGAEIIVRPPDISDDAASSESALLHSLDSLRDRDGYEPDLVVFLQCTSPVRYQGDIDRAVATLVREEADSLLSVAPSHRFLWSRANGNARPVNYDPVHRPRRQERTPEFVENGSIYVFKPWVLRQFRNRLGGKIALFEMDEATSFEIDDAFDFELVQWIARSRGVPMPSHEMLSDLRLLVLDFDGVLTDDRVLVIEGGKEAVWCSRGDGMGIALLRETGLPIVVLSRETNSVVADRCRKLGIPSYQGIGDKEAFLESYCRDSGIPLRQVAYVGNDINDIECMKRVGLPIAVADAHLEVRKTARLILNAAGGRGAVRELCDLILTRWGSGLVS
ncbi:MAG: acylneuraminate cytidylyltransferase [Thermodesulfobacteriota bacterium]